MFRFLRSSLNAPHFPSFAKQNNLLRKTSPTSSPPNATDFPYFAVFLCPNGRKNSYTKSLADLVKVLRSSLNAPNFPSFAKQNNLLRKTSHTRSLSACIPCRLDDIHGFAVIGMRRSNYARLNRQSIFAVPHPIIYTSPYQKAGAISLLLFLQALIYGPQYRYKPLRPSQILQAR